MTARPTARRRPAARRGGTPRRGGFTLLELLIAVAILAILIALLTPAVWRAGATANAAAVRSELASFETAIAQFHSDYKMAPPSHIDLRRRPTGFVNPETMPMLRAMFGTNVNEAAMVTSLDRMGFPGAGTTGPADFSQGGYLRGAECLVFFLGGLPANTIPAGQAEAGSPSRSWRASARTPATVQRERWAGRLPAAGQDTG